MSTPVLMGAAGSPSVQASVVPGVTVRTGASLTATTATGWFDALKAETSPSSIV